MPASTRANDPRSPRIFAAGALVLAGVLAACGGGAGATVAPGATQVPAGTNAGAATAAPGATTPAVGTTPPAAVGATGGPVTDVAKLCDLLGPGDFQSVAIEGAVTATVNTDGPGSAYCSFTAQSAAQGGIELDVFVTDDPQGTFNTAKGELPGLHEFLIVGADESLGTEGVAGQADKPAAVLVRKGKLVFTLGAPAGPFVPAALTALSLMVLSRATALAG